ncbi:MAG: hypothetical protein IJR68_13715 [Fretibacterium sp.]|nr:hypothetical protein [Fretibacterium sp.]
MGEMDVAEKVLEEENDVFADIINAFFAMRGITGRVVRPEDLQDAQTWRAYMADRLRWQERDVARRVLFPQGDALICLVGLENQSGIDTYMSFRVSGYEGADYQWQAALAAAPVAFREAEGS